MPTGTSVNLMMPEAVVRALAVCAPSRNVLTFPSGWFVVASTTVRSISPVLLCAEARPIGKATRTSASSGAVTRRNISLGSLRENPQGQLRTGDRPDFDDRL